MIRSSFAVAIGNARGRISTAPPAFGQEETDQRFGTVHFATSCNETAQRRFDRGMRYQHSFWYQQSKEIFEDVLKADPECAIAYWGIALSLLYNPHAPPPASNLPLGLAAIQKGKAVGAKTQRERDYIDALAVDVYRLRQDPAWRARAGLSQGHGGVGGALSRRRRSADFLRHHAQRCGFAQRQDLCQSAQRRGDPGADLQTPAAASGRGALSDPPLRHAGACGKGTRCGQAIRRDRAGRPARAAHAIAHLHARRLLEGLDRVQHRVGARGKGRTRNSHEQLHAMDYMVYAYLQLGQDRQGAGCRR